MKRFVSQPLAVCSALWDGTIDSELISKLNRAGWSTYFQTPMPGQQISRHDDETQKWVKVPSPPRLVIVGPYRNQLCHLDGGSYLYWGEADSGFHQQDGEPAGVGWAQDLDAVVTIPTPDDFKANAETDEGW